MRTVKKSAVIIVFSLLLDPCAVEASIKGVGGSVYVATSLESARLKSSADWKNTKIFKTPICHFESLKDQILADLSLMRLNGQEKLGLMLWHAHLNSNSLCSGYLLNSARQSDRSTIAKNVRKLISMAEGLGFNEVQVRFAPQWINSPTRWSRWMPELYSENSALIRSVANEQSSAKISVTFDLGSELGGLEKHDLVENYVKKMWDERIDLDEKPRAYVFSVATHTGRVARYCEWLRSSKSPPKLISLDVYRDLYDSLRQAFKEADTCGSDTPIMIQETFYNDRPTYIAIKDVSAISRHPLISIMQWPTTRGSGKGVSIDSTPKYLYFPSF